MSPNKDLPHLLVLPEDDANRQIANGFHLQIEFSRQRQMQVLLPANGWIRVIETFLSDHVFAMHRYPRRLMLLLIDCDDDADRLQREKQKIPANLTERVFVLGVLSQPEALKPELGSYEEIGSSLARACRDQTVTIWEHRLIRHNIEELDRLRERVYPILFQ